MIFRNIICGRHCWTHSQQHAAFRKACQPCSQWFFSILTRHPLAIRASLARIYVSNMLTFTKLSYANLYGEFCQQCSFQINVCQQRTCSPWLDGKVESITLNMAWNCGATGPWLIIGDRQCIAVGCEIMGESSRYWGGPRRPKRNRVTKLSTFVRF